MRHFGVYLDPDADKALIERLEPLVKIRRVGEVIRAALYAYLLPSASARPLPPTFPAPSVPSVPSVPSEAPAIASAAPVDVVNRLKNSFKRG